jgi:predicted metal-dependent peptidase
MTKIIERVKAISRKWFISEPLLFLTFVSHKLSENADIHTIRSGEGRIEYNPLWAAERTDAQLEEALKPELIRILLRHPYRTNPSNGGEAAYIASNIVLNEYYNFSSLEFHAEDFWDDTEHRKKSFEFYCREYARIRKAGEADGGAGGALMNVSDEEMRGAAGGLRGAGGNTAAENAALWGKDEFIDEKLNEIVRQAEQNALWGRLPGVLVEKILAAAKPEFDWRAVLRGFRRTIIAENNVPTRFKPSRRWGFMYMGRKPAFTTRLLAGIDVSGSIGKEDAALFYSCINRFFRYGIAAVDAVQFDSELKSGPQPLKRAVRSIEILGRGGTNYQPLIDYFTDNINRYDGLIIFTDGFASEPVARTGIARKILWMCGSRESFETHREWMSRLGRCCFVEADS